MKHLILIAVLSGFTVLACSQETTTADQITYTCAPCGCEQDGQHLEAPGLCSACNMALIPHYPGLKRRTSTNTTKTVGILLFNGADIMDVTGPWSVFEHAHFNIVTVAKTKEPVSLGMSMQLTPNFTLEQLPKVDVLVIPGGGPAESNQDETIVRWIKKQYEQTQTLFSVCSGAFFLGKAGLLDGQGKKAILTARRI